MSVYNDLKAKYDLAIQRIAELEGRPTQAPVAVIGVPQEDVEKLNEEIEHLRVQLAGCLTAAEGGTSDPVVAYEGQYGWSPAYQAVLDLRRKFDDLVRHRSRKQHRIDDPHE